MKVKRVSFHECKANSKTLDCLMFSFVHPNLDVLKNQLDDNGLFLCLMARLTESVYRVIFRRPKFIK